MKTILLFLSIAFSAQAAVPEGQERGGGRESELEFVEVAQLAGKAIERSLKNGKNDFAGFDVSAFYAAIAGTQVRAKPHLCEAGGLSCLDAQYLPELSLIELSERAWPGKTCLEKAALVTHEYGRASGNEDGNYRFSSRVKWSDEILVACDGWQGDRTEKCMNQLHGLNGSLKKSLERYRERSKKISEPDARYQFLDELKQAMFLWSRSGGDGQCRNYANRACLDTCNEVSSKYCLDYCLINRE